jgi:nucleoside-diphosphate-sugar epimerase
VPSNAPRTHRELADDLARAAGLAQPKLSSMPHWLVRSLGLVVPDLREIAAMMYQFDRPFVLDDSAARKHFGFEPTPWEALTREVMASVATVTTAQGTSSRP